MGAHLLDMRQPEQPLEPEAEAEEEDNACYAACLSEDLQLFGQLNDLQVQDLLVVSVNATRDDSKKEKERQREKGLIRCRLGLRVDITFS